VFGPAILSIVPVIILHPAIVLLVLLHPDIVPVVIFSSSCSRHYPLKTFVVINLF
jgi:hypothetical protein